MKKILGLDIGTNSIGWALLNHDYNSKQGEIIGMGSRTIPMPQDKLGKFDSGVSVSQTAERTGYRGIRRLYQRKTLRRERLHRVLHILGFLPEHYAAAIDFERHPGQFKDGTEIKLNYKKNALGVNEFIFKNSFLEMVADFKNNGYTEKIPYDWTIYYLRNKAISQEISREELAWIILNFNQKRGYYELRGKEQEDNENKLKEFCVLHVDQLIDSGDEVQEKKLFKIIFSNGWEYDRMTTQPEDWINKTREFIVTTSQTAKGEIKRTFKAVDSEKDWIAIKKKTENDLEESGLTIGRFIYQSLLKNPDQKIRGKLIKTIERKYYRDELKQILNVQVKYHNELQNMTLYKKCIDELYPGNEAHKNNIKDKDFTYLFLDDIIFFQRPLKSKKSTIAKCPYECRTYRKKVPHKTDGKNIYKDVEVTEGINVIPKSHTLYQEFRLWQFTKYLRIFQRERRDGEKKFLDVDITDQLIPNEDIYAKLYDFLNTKKEISQPQIIQFFVQSGMIDKNEKSNYRWNYVEDKKYPCNNTRTQFLTILKNIEGIDAIQFLTPQIENHLWHIIYSVKDKQDYEKALKKFANCYQVNEDAFLDAFKNFLPFDNDYGAYSYKAIRKLLPLMRMGKYWKEEDIDENTRNRIEKIINGEFDDKIRMRVREKSIDLTDILQFKGLPLWLACYVVYDRHSEIKDITTWNCPGDMEKYLNDFKQHSLRNPIVEQVVTETLRVVRDIWQYYGNGSDNYFDEIHVELAREIKNSAAERQKITSRIMKNENANLRVKALLLEFMNPEYNIENVRPYSPAQQETLRIYEDGVLNSDIEVPDDISRTINKFRETDIDKQPTRSEIKKYRLWLEQKYRSPYTGEIIPLSKLFTPAYQIEHIIPQSRYFDDSFNNKVICESEVNQLKANELGYEFIVNHHGEKVPLNYGKTVEVLSVTAYEQFVKEHYANNPGKAKKLLMDDIPDEFIERQLTDSRYISKLIKGLLSNIIREDGEEEAIAKNLIVCTGSITSRLKRDWGLNDVWNTLVYPRFERLNTLFSKDNENNNPFGQWEIKEGKRVFQTNVPIEFQKGFNKKRIDHRHHALDALIIAAANRNHVNYLNNLSSTKNSKIDRYDLQRLLCEKHKTDAYGHYNWIIKKPWETFTREALDQLQKLVISFKQNLRVINKANNKTWKWVHHNGQLKKTQVRQIKGENWAIRKTLHKETFAGAVSVREKKEVSFINGIKNWRSLVDKKLKKQIKSMIDQGMNEKQLLKHFRDNPYTANGNLVKRVEIYHFIENATAYRVELSDKFKRKQLDNVTDSGIRKILNNHLKNYVDEKGKEQFNLAFNREGLEALNKNISILNDGKNHQPIYKVRVYEKGSKFPVGYKGNKTKKYVEADEGTNLFFTIYWNEEKTKREYESIPLNKVVAHQKIEATLPKSERTPVPVDKEKGEFLFSLSPNDLVYVPSSEELENPRLVDFHNLSTEQAGRIYKMVSCSGKECYFIQHYVSSLIKKYDPISKIGEFGSMNKMETTINGERIKEICWKLSANKLGIVEHVIK